MGRNTLETSIEGIRAAWGPLSTEVIAACRRHLESLLDASPTEDWLSALHEDQPSSKEMYRDQEHGFLLLAHSEHAGLYRPPHDHGRGWVMYAVQRGEIEMGSYARIEDGNGGVKLVKRNAPLVRAGQVQVYLPGDIHDTRCLRGPALLYRLTDRDLKKEDSEAHRMTRYVARGDIWTADAS
ncbi:MAG: hypothetical protein KF911_03880 [Pseudomonadales bacterium]|nr:hypothetical protein [Pseudomonadales bacterium]